MNKIIKKRILHGIEYMLHAYNTYKDGGGKHCALAQILNELIGPHLACCNDTCKMFIKDICTDNTSKCCAAYRLESIV